MHFLRGMFGQVPVSRAGYPPREHPRLPGTLPRLRPVLHCLPRKGDHRDQSRDRTDRNRHGLRGIKFAHGILNVGEPMANPVIREVKREAFRDTSRLSMQPPGTSCPVVEAISDADLVILVTEPTPFGLHDLRTAVEVAHTCGKPMGVVINRERAISSSHPVSQRAKIEVLARIPEDRKVAESYSEGRLLLDALPEYRSHFIDIMTGLGLLQNAGSLKRREWQA